MSKIPLPGMMPGTLEWMIKVADEESDPTQNDTGEKGLNLRRVLTSTCNMHILFLNQDKRQDRKLSVGRDFKNNSIPRELKWNC